MDNLSNRGPNPIEQAVKIDQSNIEDIDHLLDIARKDLDSAISRGDDRMVQQKIEQIKQLERSKQVLIEGLSSDN